MAAPPSLLWLSGTRCGVQSTDHLLWTAQGKLYGEESRVWWTSRRRLSGGRSSPSSTRRRSRTWTGWSSFTLCVCRSCYGATTFLMCAAALPHTYHQVPRYPTTSARSRRAHVNILQLHRHLEPASLILLVSVVSPVPGINPSPLSNTSGPLSIPLAIQPICNIVPLDNSCASRPHYTTFCSAF